MKVIIEAIRTGDDTASYKVSYRDADGQDIENTYDNLSDAQAEVRRVLGYWFRHL